MQRQNKKRAPKMAEWKFFEPPEAKSDGFAVVEAAVVFPIMFMVFLALVMLAIYLPQRAMLQRSTQMAATVIATEMGDTWIKYDKDTLSYSRYGNYAAMKSARGNVYAGLFHPNTSAYAVKAEGVVKKADEKENIPLIANGDLTVKCDIVNYAVYKEIIVTSTRSIPIPVDFSAIHFPSTLEMSVTAKAVVKDGDDFVRNIDIGVSFLAWLGNASILKGIFDNPIVNMLF
jgi:Flp pilus assembly protein TadG